MSTTNDLTQAAKERFLDVNRDLLALTENGAIDIFRRISASLALNSQAQDDVMSVVSASDGTNLLDQKGFAGQCARDDFSREMYRVICQSFLRIQRNCVIEFVAKLTPEALEQLEDIEIVAGQRAPRAVVPPPPPPLTAAEQLEAEVRRDWVHLRTAEVRRKLNNRSYKAVFDRLMDSGQLASQVTSFTDGGAEFRS
jgi:hypothetical protein